MVTATVSDPVRAMPEAVPVVRAERELDLATLGFMLSPANDRSGACFPLLRANRGQLGGKPVPHQKRG
jgi:hypothetical protein